MTFYIMRIAYMDGSPVKKWNMAKCGQWYEKMPEVRQDRARLFKSGPLGHLAVSVDRTRDS